MSRYMSAAAAFDAWQRRNEAKQAEQEHKTMNMFAVTVHSQGRMCFVRPDGTLSRQRSEAAALSASRATNEAAAVKGARVIRL